MGTSQDAEQQNEALAFERFERAMWAAITEVEANGISVVIDFDTVVNPPSQQVQQDQQGEV